MSTSPAPTPPVPPHLLHELISLTSNSPRPDVFTPYIKKALTPPDISRLKAITSFLHGTSLPLSTSRLIFIDLCAALLTLPSDPFMALAHHIFSLHTHRNNTRVFAFEQNLTPIRDRASSEFETRGEFENAADQLTRIPFDAMVSTPNNGMLRYNLRTARLYIAAELTEKAEVYINRANAQFAQCSDDDMRVQHRFCQARILDAKRKFEDAAMKYYQLSHHPKSAPMLDAMSDGDFNQSLLHAVKCAILAPAGPRRSRVLAILYHDDRSRRLEIFPLLEAIHMGRLLQTSQIDKFRPLLVVGKGDIGGDGDTVLDRAVVEHNLLAASRFYMNIRFVELGVLLGISGEKAETIAARMIYENRMRASIDQVQGMLEFTRNAPTQNIERWDGHISNLCSAVDDCVEAIIDKYPQFATHMEN